MRACMLPPWRQWTGKWAERSGRVRVKGKRKEQTEEYSSRQTDKQRSRPCEQSSNEEAEHSRSKEADRPGRPCRLGRQGGSELRRQRRALLRDAQRWESTPFKMEDTEGLQGRTMIEAYSL